MKAPNGKLIIGTLEVISAVARLLPTASFDAPAGSAVSAYYYEGTTDIDWDSQRTVQAHGGAIFVDEAGGRWTEDALRSGESATGIAVLITMTESALYTNYSIADKAAGLEAARQHRDIDFEIDSTDYMIVNYGGEKS